MKKIIILIALIMLTVCSTARADEIIDLRVKEAEYVPIDGDIRPLVNNIETYTDEDVEILARLLWSSPLCTESQKVRLIWLVINRVNSRLSTFSKYDSIKKAVKKSEFGYYDRKAHISEANKEIVKSTLDSYNEWFTGVDIGEHPSAQAVYCSFYGANNEKITLYDYNWWEV